LYTGGNLRFGAGEEFVLGKSYFQAIQGAESKGKKLNKKKEEFRAVGAERIRDESQERGEDGKGGGTLIPVGHSQQD